MNNFLYLKVKNDILRKIERGEFEEGKQLPPEKELCKIYNVSQITIRRALSELMQENVLIRHQGKGTFIRKTEPVISKTRTILALLPLAANTFFYDEFYGPVWKGMEEEANINHFNLMFSSHSSHLKHKKELLKAVTSKDYAGVIVINGMEEDVLYSLRNIMPVVLVDYSLPDFFSVVSDNEGGAFEATTYLISLGHKKIACITAPCASNSYPLRVEGYKNGLKAAHIEEIFIFHPDAQKPPLEGIGAMEEIGYKTCKKLLKTRDDITAIFTVSDAVALGAMKAMEEEKINIPEDISIAGFDGIYDSAYSNPPLTTMEVPKEKMGRIAVKKLIELIRKNNIMPQQVILSPQIIIRNSTAPPHN